VPFLTAPDGVRLKYSLEGDGPPLLLHLGAGCDSELWRAAGYLEPLSKTHQCILFDHRGHGESDHPRGPVAYHIDRYEADVVALLDHLGLETASFWGYSNGIYPGIKVAERHPDRLKALIGSGAFGEWTAEKLVEARARVPNRTAEHREHGWEKLLADFDKEEPEPVPDWMKERIRATDVQQFIDWFQAYPDWGWSPWRALPAVGCPTLFLVGEFEDEEDEMAKAASLMPNGTRYRIPGHGHINAFIKSDLVLPQVTAFLAKYAA
jgi:pimeloyl-ACP methyl ester carboxylesterase